MSTPEHLNGDGSLLDYASAWLDAGYSVVPTNRDKLPDTSLLPRDEDGIARWKPYQTTKATRAELQVWFGGKRSAAGYAIVGGAVSGNSETIDFDLPDHYPADMVDKTFQAFAAKVEERQLGLMASLSLTKTKGRGLHLRYRCECEVDGNLKLACVPAVDAAGELVAKPDGTIKTEVLIETRGEGGYAVGAGTPGYVHVAGPQPWDAPTLTAEERDIILSVARSFDQVGGVVEPVGSLAGFEIDPEETAGSGKPGDDYNQRGDWEPLLNDLGLTFRFESAGCKFYKRIGSKNPIAANLGYGGKDLLRVFSSNLPIPDSGKSYSKFAVYTLLYHKGDFSAAAKELRRQGYGGQESSYQANGSNHQSDTSGTQSNNGDGAEKKKPAFRIEMIDSETFANTNYRAEFYVKNIFVAGQNMILGGAQKSMKTTVAEDMAISLGTASPFLGTFEVPRIVPTGILSGESGGFTLQEKAKCIARAKGIELKYCAVRWGFTLPQLGLSAHLEALADLIQRDGLKVLMIDPAYLCMLYDDHGRQIEFKALFSMGGVLGNISRLFASVDCTPVLLHHESKGAASVRRNDPMQLSDLSMSGFSEWARQWVLLSRRSPYEAGSGIHELWGNVGGSAGHGGLWAIDIDEGRLQEDFTGRTWNVSVNTSANERQSKASESEQRKSERQRQRDDADRGRLLQVYREVFPTGETGNQLRSAAGLSGERFTFINTVLLSEGIVERFSIKKAGQDRDAFRLKSDGTLFQEGKNNV